MAKEFRRVPSSGGIVARLKLRPVRPFSLGDALNEAESRREHRVLGLEDGDWPHYRLAVDGEREPE